LLPLKIPTTPVFAIPVCTSIPKLRNVQQFFSGFKFAIS
jgi:hypothetical protein